MKGEFVERYGQLADLDRSFDWVFWLNFCIFSIT